MANSTTFKPGQSGNPSGRPRLIETPSGRSLRELAREHTMEAMETLIAIALDDQAPAPARISAASAILDRGYGKPTLTVGDEDGNAVSWHEMLSSAQRRVDTLAPETPQTIQ